ncbi:MAG: ROK family protein, partial [Devosiaceae bacterium]|nr:ROK family protein [Devosiaceae bacterium]
MTRSPRHSLPVLIGDIGGTNARFQIVFGADKQPQEIKTVKPADYETIEKAIGEVVLRNTRTIPKSAIIAAAGPITKDGINLTNCPWDIKAKSFLRRTSFNDLVLMNDFEAQALSLPYLQTDDLCTLGDSNSPITHQQTKLVLGPGTGLGVAILIHAAGHWVPVAGEAGHVDLGPRTARERVLWGHLKTAAGRISAEQVLSGNGLCNLYQACCRADGVAQQLFFPPEISKAAQANANPQAVEALNIFCTCLGRVAG